MMNMNFRTNMELLRLLVVDYYQNNITFSEYRKKRSFLLSLIDEELNGVKLLDDEVKKNDISSSFLNKALSFLKSDKTKELN